MACRSAARKLERSRGIKGTPSVRDGDETLMEERELSEGVPCLSDYSFFFCSVCRPPERQEKFKLINTRHLLVEFLLEIPSRQSMI
jgi:hypothetical protein